MDVRTGPEGLADSWFSRFTARIDGGLTRAGIAGDFRRDCVLAALVSVFAVISCLPLGWVAEREGLVLTPLSATAVLVLAVAQSLFLAIRRTSPVLCLGIVALTQVALATAVPTGLTYRGLAPIIAAYTCGAYLAPRQATRVIAAVALLDGVIGGVAAVAAGEMADTLRLAAPSEGAGTLAPFTLWLSHFVGGVVLYVPAALIGGYMATRRRYVRLVKVTAAERVRAQRDRADAAIRAERARMARELHDIAAHHLSGMVVQAAMVERLIDRDPQAAKEATAWIRGQGKETLDNLRLVVGALRDPADGTHRDGAAGLGSDGAPVPGLAVLDRLVQTERELGTAVDVEYHGERYDLPPVADVTFYRVTQEALANARDHAPGARVRIRLGYSGSEAALEVTNDARPGGAPASGPGGARPAPAPRGHGLIGMRERAQLIGATFDAGPTASGGWRVSLVLPVDPETSAAGTETTETGGSA
ncbi:sensor histidine kinase [Marinactinospora rubrisoli]|uniref:histidine kinase n=1 Tax=Marinactinospora rubrisoli TaxID=2715399 RepID=A0ABW2KKN1_9ACTN